MKYVNSLTNWADENTIAASALVILLLAAIAICWISIRKTLATQRTARFQIEKLLKPYDHYKHSILSCEGNQTVQFDYLVLTNKGIFLLSVFDALGQVFGGNKMDEWTIVGEHKRYRLLNPQDLLFDQLAKVRTHAINTTINAYIVYTDKTAFSKGTPEHVINIDEFVSNYRPASGPEMLGDWEKLGKRIKAIAKRAR